MPVTADDPRKAFLAHFPLSWQGVAGGRFWQAYRDGKRTPAAICSEVWKDAKDRIAFHTEFKYPTNNDELMKAKLEEDREGALEFAAYVIAEAALACDNPGERAAHKKESAEAGKQRWLEGQVATPKQIAYLRRLGCPDVPQTMADASRLIDEWKREAE